MLRAELSDISVVLVDWNMPAMGGIEFIREARREARTRVVPIVMVSKETETDQIAAALDAGANEYVMKPFTAEVIVDKLRLLGLAR